MLTLLLLACSGSSDGAFTVRYESIAPEHDWAGVLAVSPTPDGGLVGVSDDQLHVVDASGAVSVTDADALGLPAGLFTVAAIEGAWVVASSGEVDSLWLSEDSGASWAPIAPAADLQHEAYSELYATPEGLSLLGLAVDGAYVMRSTDGVAWELLASGLKAQDQRPNFASFDSLTLGPIVRVIFDLVGAPQVEIWDLSEGSPVSIERPDWVMWPFLSGPGGHALTRPNQLFGEVDGVDYDTSPVRFTKRPGMDLLVEDYDWFHEAGPATPWSWRYDRGALAGFDAEGRLYRFTPFSNPPARTTLPFGEDMGDELNQGPGCTRRYRDREPPDDTPHYDGRFQNDTDREVLIGVLYDEVLTQPAGWSELPLIAPGASIEGQWLNNPWLLAIDEDGACRWFGLGEDIGEGVVLE